MLKTPANYKIQILNECRLLDILRCGCQQTEVDLYNGHKIVVCYRCECPLSCAAGDNCYNLCSMAIVSDDVYMHCMIQCSYNVEMCLCAHVCIVPLADGPTPSSLVAVYRGKLRTSLLDFEQPHIFNVRHYSLLVPKYN